MFRFTSFLCLVLIFMAPIACHAQDEGERLVWKAFDERTSKPHFQELQTTTKQVMKVMGAEVTQAQDQSFVIRWTPHLPDRNQNWLVTQEFVRVKMNIDIGGNKISHDTDNPGAGVGNIGLQDFFNAMIKAKLRFTIDRRMNVKDVNGHEEFVKKLGKANPTIQPMLESILSKEGMMQMMEPTLAPFPIELVKKGSRWQRSVDLKMGPIGTYVTNYTFTYEGKEDALDRIGITSTMRYAPPREEKEGLPFKIKKGDLRGRDGKGFALFDRNLGRFARGELSMNFEGELVIEVGGIETAIQLRQQQTTTFRTSDDRPK